MTDTTHIEVLRRQMDTTENSEVRAALHAAITALSARASAGEGGEVDRYRIKLVRDGAAFAGYALERDPDGPLCKYSQVAQASELRELLAAAPQPQEAPAQECKHKWRNSDRADPMLPCAWVQQCTKCGAYEDDN